MIFESFWPLLFLAAIPVIIILYLLKPRGTDYLISSNLLWRKMFNNEQSKTFFEKFVHNILMYLQILIVILLTIALMSPFFKVNGQSGGRTIILLDTSGSMQHLDPSGESRFHMAVDALCDTVKTSENRKFSVITSNNLGTNLLAVDSTDKDGLIRLLGSLQADDCSGDLTSAQNMLDQAAFANPDEAAGLIICTDGDGAKAYESLHGFEQKELWVFGEATSNVSNDYLSFTQKEDGTYDVIASVTNHSDQNVTFDVTLKDEDSTLLSVKQMSLKSDESNICLFNGITWNGGYLSATVSGFSFENKAKDSLSSDNMTYAIKTGSNDTSALLVGNGNTFVEKAYKAVSGNTISKATAPSSLEDYRFHIFDAGFSPDKNTQNALIFGGTEYAEETIKNVMLSVEDCDLTTNLSGFHIGVNKTTVYTLPDWATSFLECNEKCVGYYGEHDGIREVVVGFDIRESDFPLRAEFPIFLANAMNYLSDSSWLTSNVCYSGEAVSVQPWAEVDQETNLLSTAKAGLYSIGNDTYKEYYTVRFQTTDESDGRATADSILMENTSDFQKVKKTLRNVFLILAILLLCIEWVLYVKQMRYKGKFYPVVRGLVLLALTLALLGVQISKGTTKTTTIFVVDISNSNESHRQEISDYLKQTIRTMPSRNQYGIVTFGLNSLVEQFLTEDPEYSGLMTVPETGATCYEDAISRALAMVPGDSNARLVILTDGKQTKGDINNLSFALSNSNTELLTILYESEQTKDAYIENVTLPTYLHPNDLYSVTVEVESNYDTNAVISLYHGSNLSDSNSVHLNKGGNRFVFQQKVTDDTMESLHVKIEAEGDTCPENDSYNAYSVVEAAPKVLVISGRKAKTGAFSNVLSAANYDYSVVSGINAPDSIDKMLEYRCIILADAYIDELPGGFINNLESYVKDYGCGFICCGGENSFALGGYRDTSLEKVLPVDMILTATNQTPSMAMVMIIDHSGSMSYSEGNGPTNLDVAIRAATVAVDNLRADDYVGVLTFDDRYTWQVNITQNTDRQEIKNRIETIAEGGGTTIKPAVHEAFSKISQTDVSIKHVVLLTDGMGETTDYRDVISEYSKAGITLSTVAVGDDCDEQLLEDLANRCGGRYYHSTISTDLPRIFAQEVFLGGDSYIQNGDISLSVRTSHEFTRNLFEEGWPNLNGYIAATAKPAATRVIVSTEKEDPILTVWQYGLGRSVAWNSDISGEWTGTYSGQEDYVKLWKRVIDYTAGNGNLGDDSVNVVTAGDVAEISYSTEQYDGRTEIIANVIRPDGTAEEIKLHATAPGRFKASIPTSSKGLYHYNIRKEQDGAISNYITTASAVQFSDEYKFNVSTKAYLSFMDKYGKIISKNDNIWTSLKSATKEKYPLTNLLMGLALLLFLADVAMRRFQYAPKFLFLKKLAMRRTKSGKNSINIEETATVGSVTDSKNGAMAGGEASYNNGAATSAGTTATGTATSGTATTESGKSNTEKTKKKEKKKDNKKEAAASTLDTSLLLKKKDDRNI